MRKGYEEDCELLYDLIKLKNSKTDVITLSEIEDLTKFSKRYIKELITILRNEYPICTQQTGRGGYWIPKDKLDIKEFIAMLETRKNSMGKTIANMKRFLNE